MSKGLVLNLKMRDKQGSIVTDYSRYGNDGAVNGGVVWTEQGMRFDGSTGYLNCGSDESLDITEAITISVWIYPTGWGENDQGRVVDKSFATGHVLMVYKTENKLYFASSNAGVLQFSNIDSIELNKWQHVVVTYDKANVKFYVNSVYAGGGAETASLGTNNEPLYIGNNAANTRTFNGSIDQVRIYNYALPLREIKAMYNSTRHNYD